jgi:hypothetical protein
MLSPDSTPSTVLPALNAPPKALKNISTHPNVRTGLLELQSEACWSKPSAEAGALEKYCRPGSAEQ